jgi:hypothetical protein
MAMDVFSYSNRSIKRLIITIALLAIMLRPSLGQSADRNDSPAADIEPSNLCPLKRVRRGRPSTG